MNRWRIIFTAVLVVAVVAFLTGFPAIKRHVEAVKCSNQMHRILYSAVLLWSDEHGGQLPSEFLSMSNELITPRTLDCPGDHSHQAAASWTTFTTNNCSYEIVAPGIRKSDTNVIFLRC